MKLFLGLFDTVADYQAHCPDRGLYQFLQGILFFRSEWSEDEVFCGYTRGRPPHTQSDPNEIPKSK